MDAHHITQHFLNHLHTTTGPPTIDPPNPTPDTRINHIPLTIDQDWDMGYLLELIHTPTKQLAYLAIADTPKGTAHQWWPHNAGTLHHPNTTPAQIAAWATTTIHDPLTTLNTPPHHTPTKQI